MTKKLTCSITGNWSYCDDARYAKLVAKAGGEDELKATYQSRAGQKLVIEHNGDIDAARAAAQTANYKNKLACVVTGELMFCSDERMAKLMAKGKTDEAGVRASYVSRVANRRRKEMTPEGKKFSELEQAEQTKIDDQIRVEYAANQLPPPAAPKGSKQNQTTEPVAPKAPKAPKAKKDTEVRDTVPGQTVLDPLRIIEGEATNERKARIRRERRAMAKLVA